MENPTQAACKELILKPKIILLVFIVTIKDILVYACVSSSLRYALWLRQLLQLLGLFSDQR